MICKVPKQENDQIKSKQFVFAANLQTAEWSSCKQES